MLFKYIEYKFEYKLKFTVLIGLTKTQAYEYMRG